MLLIKALIRYAHDSCFREWGVSNWIRINVNLLYWIYKQVQRDWSRYIKFTRFRYSSLQFLLKIHHTFSHTISFFSHIILIGEHSELSLHVTGSRAEQWRCSFFHFCLFLFYNNTQREGDASLWYCLVNYTHSFYYGSSYYTSFSTHIL